MSQRRIAGLSGILRAAALPVALLHLFALPAAGSAPPDAADPPRARGARNTDARAEINRGFRASPLPAQAGALNRLRESVPGLAVTIDRTTGATRSLLSHGGYLTGPEPAADALVQARRFVSTHHELLGLTPADLAGLEVTDRVHSRLTGATHIYMRQRHLDLSVYNGQLQVNVNRDGRILSVNNAFLPGIALATGPATPALSAVEAVAAVAGDLGLPLSGPPAVISAGTLPERFTRIRTPGLSRKPVEARLMWLPIRAGIARLVWNMQLATPDGDHVYDLTVDAGTGKVWTRFDWIDEDSYRVYPHPLESPNHASTPPPADGRQIVADPADPLSSPFGWHDTDGSSGAEFTIHRGNNVHAYDDIDNLEGGLCTSTPGPPAVEPDCGGSLDCDFDFPIDFSLEDPLDYTSGAVTNLFYWSNLIHDIQYRYGFDEAAGNFQENNYGNGGLGSDYVLAEAQDGGGFNNANFCTPPEGQRPRMQMFLSTSTSPRRDGDLDNSIIVHEYGHGISNRLVGGPSNVSCLRNRQRPSEGLSDWWALVYTARSGDQGADPRGLGTYGLGQPVDGPGIRTQRYSTDPAINTHRYSTISLMAVPHGVGEVWAQAAWEAYWALVGQHGFDPDLRSAAGGSGNQRAMLYVSEGLKNTICSPAFTDLRDGIILAAMDNHGGEDLCLLWESFAAFGLGTDALSGGPNSTTPVEGFEVPAACPGPPIVNVQASQPVAEEAGPVSGELRIIRTRDTGPALTVHYAVGGTATPGDDYVALSGTIDLASGQSMATISIDPNDDTLLESIETVTLTIQPDPSYQVGAATATVFLVSDEAPPLVSVQATVPTATENPPADGEFTVTREGNYLPPMSVNYSVFGSATAGLDYEPLAVSVPFSDGQITATISVVPLDDPDIERPEEVTVNILSSLDYDILDPNSGQATVLIVSDESPPIVSAAATLPQASEAGATPGQFTITRSGDVSRLGPVYYAVGGTATPGADYGALSGVALFGPGQTVATIGVVPVDDGEIEIDETVSISLLPDPDYDVTGTDPEVVIASDEIIPELGITAVDPLAGEAGSTSGAFRITRGLNNGSESLIDLGLGGTATSGTDFSAIPVSLTMGPGVSTLDIFVDPLPDQETEGDETVQVTLLPNPLYTLLPAASATVTILEAGEPCSLPGPCDDGRFCNGAETCAGGFCQAAAQPACDDGVACTTDTCDETSDTCGALPEDSLCDNGLFCDGVELCDPGLGCRAGSPVLCDDGIACTINTCDEAAGACAAAPADLLCGDGLFCNGAEICDALSGCQAGPPPCPAGTFCDEAAAFCDPDLQCAADPDCDDGSQCTIDTCAGGLCFNDCAAGVQIFPYAEALEAGFGDWDNGSGDDLDWTRLSGPTPTAGTGPPGDHTTGSGFYLYLESSDGSPGDAAILDGPCLLLEGTSAATLSFWYHMSGAETGSLAVEASPDCAAWTALWSLSGDQGGSWQQAAVDLHAHAGSTAGIRIIATRGGGELGDIAVDDISVDVVTEITAQWADPVALTWNTGAGAVEYRVYRGSLASFADADEDGLPDSGYGSCLNSFDPDPSDTIFIDSEEPTPAEIGFHYLVSYTVGSSNVAQGATSQGIPRPLAPCP